MISRVPGGARGGSGMDGKQSPHSNQDEEMAEKAAGDGEQNTSREPLADDARARLRERSGGKLRLGSRGARSIITIRRDPNHIPTPPLMSFFQSDWSWRGASADRAGYGSVVFSFVGHAGLPGRMRLSSPLLQLPGYGSAMSRARPMPPSPSCHSISCARHVCHRCSNNGGGPELRDFCMGFAMPRRSSTGESHTSCWQDMR